MDTTKASYRWTRDELVKAMTYHYRLRYPRWLRILLNIVFAIYPFIGIVFIVYGMDWAGGGFLILTGILWWLKPLHRLYFGRGFHQRPDHDRLTTWEFSEAGFRHETEGIGKGEASWNFLMRVGETREGFLLYPIRNLFFWIPFSSFEHPDGAERVRHFLKENNVRILKSP